MPKDFHLWEFVEPGPGNLDAVAAIMRAYGHFDGGISTGGEGGLDALTEPGVSKEELAQWRADTTRQEEIWSQDLDRLEFNGALKRFGIGSPDVRCPSVRSVVFLQLYNHLADDTTIRECADMATRNASWKTARAAPAR